MPQAIYALQTQYRTLFKLPEPILGTDSDTLHLRPKPVTTIREPILSPSKRPAQPVGRLVGEMLSSPQILVDVGDTNPDRRKSLNLGIYTKNHI